MGLGSAPDGPGKDLRQGQIPAGNGQFGQGSAEVCGEPVDGMQTAVVARRGVTPSRTTSDPPCPDAGRPTDAKSSLGRAGSPGSETSSVRIRPVCTSPSQGPRKAGNGRRTGADQQLSRRVWHGMIDSGKAWRRILPKRAADVQPARRAGGRTRHRNLPANSRPRFTPSGGGPDDAGPLPTGTGRVGSRWDTPCSSEVESLGRADAQLTERHPGPRVHESGMRAPVQKMRSRRTGKQAASGAGQSASEGARSARRVPRGRPLRARAAPLTCAIG